MSAYTFNPLQGAWLALEDKNTPMHMGMLLYFDIPKGAGDDYVAGLAAQMRSCPEVQAPWNLRLRRLGLMAWQWTEDRNFDLDYHFRHSALPAPGGERQIGELVSRLHAHPMDLSKPLWEVHLIEGLHGHRFALYIKVHPAMMDSAAARAALLASLSPSARARKVLPLWCHARAAQRRANILADDWPQVLRALGHRLKDSLLARHGWSSPHRVPRSALNDSLSPQRRFATQSYAVSRLEAVGEQFGASPEEILYYLASSALRRFFKEFNALPDDSLVALVADRARADEMLSPLFIRLGTQHAGRHKRLAEIRRTLNTARRQVAVLKPADARAEGAVDALPYMLRQLVGVDHRLKPLFNVGMVRLELSDKPLYLNGARLEAAFPMPMLLEGGALSFAFLRYADQWGIGLMGAREKLPHLQRMAVYMGLALEELEAMADE